MARALGVRLLAARDLDEAPAARLVFVAVPDQHVAAIAARLGPTLGKGSALVHLSGSLPLAALEPAPRRGSLHPLQSFPAPKPPEHFTGAFAAIDGSDPELVDELAAVARALGMSPHRVTDAQRTLYHAAAVIAANDLVALAASAVEVLEAIGWGRDEALAALLPLQRGTLENLAHDGLPGALIGPVRRGDHATVARQLQALRSAPGLESAADVYRILALKALKMARDAGLDEEAGRRIDEALTD